jgi:hypothetical protein
MLQRRLRNQSLNKPEFTSPPEVVKWFCAMQAQDYLGALWSVGQRMKKCVENDIEISIAKREIVRTWPMRGTLHFLAADDVRWVVSLLAPRVVTRAKSIYQQQGLDKKILDKGRKVIEKALEKSPRLTRPELYAALEKNKIPVTDQRGLHIIGYAAQQLSICFGPREGKQHTFVLLDEWIPKSKILSQDESLAEITRRYFDARGPATINDLCWWTGLTLKEAKRGIDMIGTELTAVKVDDEEYWFKPSTLKRSSQVTVLLLSWFDEFIIGYRDRSAAFDPATEKFIAKPKNGLYTPVILVNGKIAGNWKRSFVKDELKFETRLFRKFSSEEETRLEAAIERYRQFADPKNQPRD